MATAADLAQALKQNREPVLFCTGAGVSAASGIPTFRGTDKDAVWSKDVMTLATREHFDETPAGSWEFYLRRFDGLEDKAPNAAHQALVQLEAWHAAREIPFLLVTQNIDTLHEKAGSREMVKVHGTSDRVRCSRNGCEWGAPKGSLLRAEVDFAPFRAAMRDATVPRCPKCGAALRAHVLWFDERYDEHVSYDIGRVRAAALRAAIVVFAGTSFAVGVTAMILEYAAMLRARVFSIDPAGLRPDPRVETIAAGAEVVLPQVMKAL